MEYYMLTDAMNHGDIVREENGLCYAYSYTRDVWERSAVLFAYRKSDSPLFRQYHTVSTNEANKLMRQRHAAYDHLLAIGRKNLFQAYFGRRSKKGDFLISEKLEAIDLCMEMEAKIVAAAYLLYDPPQSAALTAAALQKIGFSLRMIEAYQTLFSYPGETRDTHFSRIRRNYTATDVKLAELQVLSRDGDHRQQALSDIAFLKL